MRLSVFTDFDGTITLSDCNVTLAATFHAVGSHDEIQAGFFAGHISLWEALDASLQACDIPLEEAIAYLRAHVSIDPTFAAFDAHCAARGIPLEVVSAGAYEIVTAFLESAGLTLPVTANRARVLPGRFGLAPLVAGCATGVDKAAVVSAAREAGATTVFIGDGLSDRFAVHAADVVYAKSGLATYCTERGVPFTAFERFADIQRDLAARFPDA